MADDLRNGHGIPMLQVIEPTAQKPFEQPSKRINDGDDLSFFLRSSAYADIMTWILQLNRSMIPVKRPDDSSLVDTWPLQSKNITLSDEVLKLNHLIRSLDALMEKAPPESGPRRFGNAAFRTWYKTVQEATPSLLRDALSDKLWGRARHDAELSALNLELAAYLLGSFGSPERLDYGTGHELSFLAFLACIWKLGGFAHADSGLQERAIVTAVIQPYLDLVRKLILTYSLEPAGSHGVWGLDDHSFIPYILGSAQYCAPIHADSTVIPNEGSLSGSPSPNRTAKNDSAEMYRDTNMYFSAIAFIFDVKKGPFWEHSPTLFDISGIKDGWAKINKGMIKMYNAEVLSKFPVVQHFPFGSLFRWEHDPRAPIPTTSAHMGSQPKSSISANTKNMSSAQPSTRAPWSGGSSAPMTATPITGAPWAANGPSSAANVARAPWSRAPPGSNRPA
ncbi:phosphotyrosyl phosphatase activator, partial [Aureobasidium melanogenum]|uniref:Serine/threonine-protein phosphatase 2A activator n=1 Tax=Aureobasidium melanogenum (strain CBS 110374) TaxID=1043003 RepID=A0A074VLT5_AURM1